MLKLVISGEEMYDEDKQEFIPAIREYTLTLEHSLLSVAKWEAIYHKAFLSTDKNIEQIKVYAKCMTINPNVPDVVYEHLTSDQISQIADYIKDEQTATWFSDGHGLKKPAHSSGKMNGEVITAEIIYYWMISYNIPVEFQKWHLNRLLTLIKVISIKNDPNDKGRKMSVAERKALNLANRAKYHTRG